MSHRSQLAREYGNTRTCGRCITLAGRRHVLCKQSSCHEIRGHDEICVPVFVLDSPMARKSMSRWSTNPIHRCWTLPCKRTHYVTWLAFLIALSSPVQQTTTLSSLAYGSSTRMIPAIHPLTKIMQLVSRYAVPLNFIHVTSKLSSLLADSGAITLYAL